MYNRFRLIRILRRTITGRNSRSCHHLYSLLLILLGLLPLVVMVYWIVIVGGQHQVQGQSQLQGRLRVPLSMSSGTGNQNQSPNSNKTNNENDTNYFLNFERYLNRGYIVSTPTCHILDLDPFDPSVLPIIEQAKAKEDEENEKKGQRDLVCTIPGKRIGWTYTVGTDIVFNTTALRNDGISFSYLDCCYIYFIRVEQSIYNYNYDADRITTVSTNCIPLHKPITPTLHPFIRVICRGKWPLPPDVLYREFHALPMKGSIIQDKSKYWNNNNNSLPDHLRKPPNFVLIGLDSTSRLNFLRNMPKTKKVLLDKGFIEFFGYTKVGENTFPNVVPMMSGYSEEEIVKFCYFSQHTAQDRCPHIWKRFKTANYLTSLVEDWPSIAIFHFEKTGFVQEPVDLYFRPYLYGVQYQLEHLRRDEARCIGTKPSWEVLLKYINDLNFLAASQNGFPIFLLSWLTSLAHDSLNGLSLGDETYAQFFKNYDYTNTIMICLGDHGYRFGDIRKSFIGWSEDKLPVFWAYLPESVRSQHPSWYENLKENARRLTSPFDLFSTMSHILDEYTPTVQMPHGTNINGTKFPRIPGKSLFTPIPMNRTCEDAGIPSEYCACAIPQSVPINDTNLNQAAQTTVQNINTMLQSENDKCSNLTLVQVTAGAFLEENESGENKSQSGTYIVGFETKPGNFLFEAHVQLKFNPKTNHTEFEETADILRMSKMTNDFSCVNDTVLQRFCYCKT